MIEEGKKTFRKVFFPLSFAALREGGKPFSGTFYLQNANKKCLSILYELLIMGGTLLTAGVAGGGFILRDASIGLQPYFLLQIYIFH